MAPVEVSLDPSDTNHEIYYANPLLVFQLRFYLCYLEFDLSTSLLTGTGDKSAKVQCDSIFLYYSNTFIYCCINKNLICQVNCHCIELSIEN